YQSLRLQVDGVDLPETAIWKRVGARAGQDDRMRLRWRGDGIEITREFLLGRGPYQLWSTVRLKNIGNRARTVRARVHHYHYVRRADEKGGFFAARAPGLSHGVCRSRGESLRKEGEALLQAHGYPKAAFVGVENTYFASVLAPIGAGGAVRCSLKASYRGGTVDDPTGTLFDAALRYPWTKLSPGQSVRFTQLAYIGPKALQPLRRAGHELAEVVDLGFFSWIAESLARLLAFIEGFVGNWGLAIVLLTVLVKLLLFPLTEKSFRSMARMRVLKPEMDRINELYKDDREKKGAAVMELYRRHKINPVGGCLPQLLQMPIWFALYASLSSNVKLYHAPFVFWLTDLSAPDPYFVLPLLLGILMYVQQRLTPTSADPAQAKMMLYLMPTMITAFMLFLPAGLCVYMVTNSVLGMAQQHFINYRVERQAASAAPPAPTPPSSEAPSETPLGKGRTRRVHRGGRLVQGRHRRGRA
ncbi:MAG: membrane protein insertase YidC, partial [Polyangiales bacterium]